MKIEHASEHVRPYDNTLVRLKQMGNVTEVFWMTARPPTTCPIRKLDKYHYVDTNTGEVKEFNHIKSRADNLESVRKSLRRGQEIIHTNTADLECCALVTLTYRQREDDTQECTPMTDPQKLYRDTKNFIKRLRRIYGHFEYNACAEPQKSGSLHQHIILIFAEAAPDLSCGTMAEIWGHGSAWVADIENIRNLALYLTAYLRDSESEGHAGIGPIGTPGPNIVEKKVQTKCGETTTKRFEKFGRLHMYPPQFNIFRYSRGIKIPDTERMTEAEAMERIGDSTLTYEKTLCVLNEETGFRNTLNYRYYDNPQTATG